MGGQLNIFYKVTKRDENAATELLVNLLGIKFFRDICLDFWGIPKQIYDNIKAEHISTQYSIDGCMADICIRNDDALYLIENKIRSTTEVLDSQVSIYPEYVIKEGKDLKEKGCIFIIPQKCPAHEDKIEKAREQFKSITVKIVYWDAFLKHLSEMELENCSLIIKESLEFLRDLIFGPPVDNTLTIYEVAAMYNPKEIYTALTLPDKNSNPVVSALLEKNLNRILNAVDRLTKKLGDKATAAKILSDKDGYGRYIHFKNRDKQWALFLGLTPCLAKDKEYEDYVYSLAIEERSVKTDLIDSINKEKFPYYHEKGQTPDQGQIYMKIDRKLFLDDSQEEEILEKVIEIIQEVFCKICK